NARNGTTGKTVKTEDGDVELAIPRDRAGTFTTMLVPKGTRRLGGLDEMIISLYAGGMTIRDMVHHLASTLGTDLSHETISNIIDEITDEVLAWQTRPLEPFYPAGVSRCDLGENSRWGSRAQQGRPHRYRCGYGRD